MNDKFHLILALARCSMSNSPTEAVKHQIRRIATSYLKDGYEDRCDKLMDLFSEPTEEEKGMKIVQS